MCLKSGSLHFHNSQYDGGFTVRVYLWRTWAPGFIFPVLIFADCTPWSHPMLSRVFVSGLRSAVVFLSHLSVNVGAVSTIKLPIHPAV